VSVGGTMLPAGKYSLATIPTAEEWTVIFSRNSTSWGAYSYDPKEDALRVRVKSARSEYREWLTYEFTDRQPDKATVALMWENLQVPIRIAVPDVHDRYVAEIRRELRDRHGFSWINWMAAAQYCLANKTHLSDGLWFAEQAVGWEGVGVANFQTLTVLAQLQIANGKPAEATKTIERAMAPMAASALQLHQFGRQLQQQGENRLALTVFETNARRHPNAWPVNLGLARGHAALGDRSKAVSFATKALAQAPDEANRKNIETLIQQWKAPPAK
jgi:tetratricopeptide (TPR) repeat protein